MSNTVYTPESTISHSCLGIGHFKCLSNWNSISFLASGVLGRAWHLCPTPRIPALGTPARHRRCRTPAVQHAGVPVTALTLGPTELSVSGTPTYRNV